MQDEIQTIQDKKKVEDDTAREEKKKKNIPAVEGFYIAKGKGI